MEDRAIRMLRELPIGPVLAAAMDIKIPGMPPEYGSSLLCTYLTSDELRAAFSSVADAIEQEAERQEKE